MKVKTYRGATLAEALAEVKKEMGPNAVIIQTRRLRQGGFLGVLATEVVEVTAAIDENFNKPPQPSSLPAKKEKAATDDDAKILALHLELASLRKTVENALKTPKKMENRSQEEGVNSSKLTFVEEWAKKNDVELSAAEALLQGISSVQVLSAPSGQARLKERLFSYFQNVEGILIKPGTCKTVALIGPTGVGKTTTVAKLAAKFALREKYRVALITADTYRIAAVEQLKTYADLIGIPIEVIYNQQELKGALYRHQDKHLILIDTAGRSPSNPPQMAELESLMAVDDKIEKYLVLSATTRFSDNLEAVRKFQLSRPDKYLFTKIDEATNIGTVFSLIYQVPKPLSYITTGQNVPDDIELADPTRLTTMMLRGKK